LNKRYLVILGKGEETDFVELIEFSTLNRTVRDSIIDSMRWCKVFLL